MTNHLQLNPLAIPYRTLTFRTEKLYSKEYDDFAVHTIRVLGIANKVWMKIFFKCIIKIFAVTENFLTQSR